MQPERSTPRFDIWRAVFLPGVIASATLFLLYLATVDWRLPLPRDLHGYVLGRDFLNFWTYGREAWQPEAGRFYDIVRYNLHLDDLTGREYETQQWSYPPHLMLLMAPLGLLPYLPAYLLWTALGCAALWRTAPKELGWRGPVALLLAPAGIVSLVSGQMAFFCAALLIGIFRSLDARPLLAGILLGLLTVKPQLGLLFPLVLLMTGRFTVFAAAAATTLALAVATALFFGPEIWTRYFVEAVPLQEQVIADPTRAVMGMMPTVYMNVRILGFPAGPAYAAQAVAAALAVAAVVWTFRRRRDPLLSYALFIVASLVATPYLMSYDLVVTAWVMLALALSGAFAARDRPLLLAVYFLPLLAIAAELAGLPGSALVLPAFAIWLLGRLPMDRKQKRPTASVEEGYSPAPIAAHPGLPKGQSCTPAQRGGTGVFL
jgi:hypothetical protein